MADILSNAHDSEVTSDGAIPAGFLYATVTNIGDGAGHASETASKVNEVTLRLGSVRTYPFTGKPYKEVKLNPNGNILLLTYVI